MSVYMKLTTVRGNAVLVAIDQVAFVKSPDDGSVGTLVGLTSGQELLVGETFAVITAHLPTIE